MAILRKTRNMLPDEADVRIEKIIDRIAGNSWEFLPTEQPITDNRALSLLRLDEGRGIDEGDAGKSSPQRCELVHTAAYD